MKKLLVLFFFLSYLFPSVCQAVTVTINNAPNSVSQDSFNVDVSVLGASSGKNYLRAQLYKDGTSNYFGETHNGNSWYKGSDGTQYYPITIQDSKTTASASLQVRIGTPTAGEYPGQGTYKLKIKRYTSSGNAANDDVNSVDVSINLQVASSPTPTPKVASSSTNSSSPKTTSVKVSTPTPTKQPSLIPENNSLINTITKKIVNNSDKIATDFARVRNLTPTTKPRVAVLGESDRQIPFWPFITAGIIFMIISGAIYIFKNWESVKSWITKE